MIADSGGHKSTEKPIIKEGARILRPSEFELLREGAMTLENRTKLEGLLVTGMRYVEAQRLLENPGWFDGKKFIFLPREAVKKQKRKQKDRTVWLSWKGASVLPHFLEIEHLPDWKTWAENLRRWAGRVGLDPIGLSPKTTRKSWESWLVSSFPSYTPQIFLSQGHTSLTALEHYLNMPFVEKDKEGMKPWVEGWV